MSEMKPLARKTDIVVQNLENETLVYDLITNKALALNETSSMVWSLCDGKQTVDEIANKMTINLKEIVTPDLVWLSLEQLKKENMLENESVELTKFEGLSRREVVRKIGFASMVMLPLIASLVAPLAVNSASIACLTAPPAQPNTCPCLSNAGCSSTCCGVVSGAEVCLAIDATPLGSPCRGNCECAGSATCPTCVGFPRICRIGACPP